MNKLNSQQVADLAKALLAESEQTESLDTDEALVVLENVVRLAEVNDQRLFAAKAFVASTAWCACYTAGIVYCASMPHAPAALIAALAGLFVPSVLAVFMAVGAINIFTQTRE